MDSLRLIHSGGYAVLLVTTMTWLQATVFLVIHQGLLGVYLGCSFAPNHKGMPILTAEQGRAAPSAEDRRRVKEGPGSRRQDARLARPSSAGAFGRAGPMVGPPPAAFDGQD
jgi:hypothetical protein